MVDLSPEVLASMGIDPRKYAIAIFLGTLGLWGSNLWLVVDELSGRKRRLHLMVNGQEPNRLNGTILNGVSEFVCFRLQSPAALDLVKKTYGFDAEEVSNLQPLQFVARNLDSGGELRGSIKL